MHEYSLMEQIVQALLDKVAQQGAGGKGRVQEVSFCVGALEIHSEESFRQAFDLCVQGTPLRGAMLKVKVVFPRIQCVSCGYQNVYDVSHEDVHDFIQGHAPCPACGKMAVLEGGRGVDGLELRVEEQSA